MVQDGRRGSAGAICIGAPSRHSPGEIGIIMCSRDNRLHVRHHNASISSSSPTTFPGFFMGDTVSHQHTQYIVIYTKWTGCAWEGREVGKGGK